jgi:hypothetical protein
MSRLGGLLLVAALTALPAAAEELSKEERARAVVVTPAGLSGPAAKAVRMLVEEVEQRSMVRWDRAEKWPGGGTPVVVVGPADGVRELLERQGVRLPAAERPRPEGYRIGVVSPATSAPGVKAPVVWVAGNDARGVLFGAGRLLRELRPGRGCQVCEVSPRRCDGPAAAPARGKG